MTLSLTSPHRALSLSERERLAYITGDKAAAEVLALAVDEMLTAIEDARSEGYDDGYDDGLADGLASTSAEEP